MIDTDYVIGRDNFQGKVFGISPLPIVLFVAITLAPNDEVSSVFNVVREWLTNNLSWFF